MTPHPPKPAPRYHCLDIVRGLVAVSVALGHMQAYLPESSPTLLARAIGIYNKAFYLLLSGRTHNPTYPGVVVFIVLSGFCIHLPVAGRTERIRRRGFWTEYALRRFTRIVPVYWAGCLLGIAVVYFLDRSRTGTPPWLNNVALSPWTVARKILFIDPALPDAPVPLGNPAIRTVATELWLYALYPLAIYGIFRFRGLSRWSAIAAIYAASVALAFAPLPFNPNGLSWAYESVPRFFVWWLIGAAAADVYRATRPATLRGSFLAAGAFFLAMVTWNLLPRVHGGYLVATPLVVGFSASLLVLLMRLEDAGHLRATRGVRAFSFVGERSYSLYAIHMPILGLAYACSSNTIWQSLSRTVGENTLCVTLIAGGTLATYALIEAPSHRLSKAFARSVPPTTDTTGHTMRPVGESLFRQEQ